MKKNFLIGFFIGALLSSCQAQPIVLNPECSEGYVGVDWCWGDVNRTCIREEQVNDIIFERLDRIERHLKIDDHCK